MPIRVRLQALLGSFLRRHMVFRFIAVGVFNTGFCYAVYAFFLFVGVDFALANLASMIASVFLGFRTQGVLVFRNADRGRFWRFVLAWVTIYFVTIAAIRGFMHFGYSAYVAGLLHLPFTVSLSYLINRYIVFRISPVDSSNTSPISEKST